MAGRDSGVAFAACREACCSHGDGFAGLSEGRTDGERREPDRGEVAYVLNGFPRLSETFIANEIYLLETMGMRLRLYSVKREQEPKVHAVVGKIQSPVCYLPAATSLSGSSIGAWLVGNLPRFLAHHRRVFARRPFAYLRTLILALRMSWKYRLNHRKLRKVFVKEFVQAGYIAADVLARPEVAHLHGHFCHGVATVTWFVSLLTGIPYSFTAHAKDIYQADLNPGDLLARKLAAARFVVTCTQANADHLKRRYPEADGILTIYHGLDTAYFAPEGQPENRLPVILSVGRMVAKKGFTHLVEACALLAGEGIEFACLIVGERGDAYDDIRETIERHKLNDRVRLLGAMTQDELRTLYRGARLFALPCQVMEDGDRDGIPNVLAEAMASGVPVVATRVSGIPELVKDGEDGLLVESRDVAGLALALRRLLTDAALSARLACAGRKRICESFDSRRTTVALRDLFAEAIDDARAAHEREWRS